MNALMERLYPYPFEKLRELISASPAPPHKLKRIALSIGEPRHAPPAVVEEALRDTTLLRASLGSYPKTVGTLELRRAAASWASRRFKLHPSTLTAQAHVLPVCGTREGLFSFAQAIVSPGADQLVLMPNPFYQIYEGATLLAGAVPRYVPCVSSNGWAPDFSHVCARDWERCALLFLCSPGNPSGTVLPIEALGSLIELADRHRFVIAADECYSEIYADESKPPVGLLEACAVLGRHDYRRCIVFHSLSKRSNMPGLRSGFVAGDAAIIERYLRYRTYHGCTMPLMTQRISELAWNDESHTVANRALYREKLLAVARVLRRHCDVQIPEGGFYLWLQTPIDDQSFCQRLFSQYSVTAFPGTYLARTVDGVNPGEGRVRIALVADADECMEAAERIGELLSGL